jgi:DNA-nicking Smr family endonuclease
VTADDKQRRRRGLSDDDHALWRGFANSVSPLKRRRASAPAANGQELKGKNAPAAPKPLPAAITRPAPAPKRTAPPLMPLDRRAKQRLARGTETIDGRIDLHGKTQSEAHAALLRFLRRAQADGARFVLVITGKGRGRASDLASERGVLKRQVPLWLRLPEFRAYVLGVEEAHVGHGGEGALYVRVRRARAG